MNLAKLIATNSTVPISSVSDDKELVRDIQKHLSRLGILDPPVDGDFGPVSKLAAHVFATAAGIGSPALLDPALASSLVQSDPEVLFPVDASGSNLASALWRTMEAKRYWLARAPGLVNIVYVEGANPDGSPNGNPPNEFNDVRYVLGVDEENRKPVLLGRWEGTTEPGKYFTITKPMNVKGAARIALDQFKAWVVGTHGTGAGAHEALVQRGVIRVHRDLNRDFKREGDAVDTGSSFGVNQHWGYDLPMQDVGQASAGCLVGRTKAGHRKFMEIVKEDLRYKANNGYRFMAAVLAVEDLSAEL